MIYNYFDFILEEYLKLDVPLYYSKTLKETFSALFKKGDKVASILFYAEENLEYQTDMAFIDLGTGNDKISFIQVNRVLRMMDKESGDPESKNQGQLKGQLPEDYLNKMYRLKMSQTNAVWNQQRTEIQIGRFVTKVLQKTTNPLNKIDQNDINDFVDKFKAYRDFQTAKKDKFEVVSGEDIRKWYDESNYEDAAYHLSNSCMRYERCQDYLDIYTENTGQVSMVIMKGTNPDKIIGRALIWKLKNGETYLDRPYANNDEDVNLFKEWAKNKGYKIYGDGYQHKEVTLSKCYFEYYPYMDTFKYLNREEKLLSTDGNKFEDRNPNWIRLESTGGDFEEPRQGIYSQYYDMYIDEDDAVYAEDLQSYIPSEESYYLEYKDQYVSNEADVVSCEYDGQYYLSEDTVYSEYLDDHIYDREAAEVHYSLDDTVWVPDNFLTKGMADEYKINNNFMVCLSSKVFKSPYAKEYLFRSGTVKVYKLEDGSMVTKAEAEEKEHNISDYESDWVDIDVYLNKVKKITKDELLEKLKTLDFTTTQIEHLKEKIKRRSGYRRDLLNFYQTSDDDVFKKIIRFLIYFGYDISEKNEFGKVRRKNRNSVIDSNPTKVEQFISKKLIDRLTSSTIEIMIEICDSQLSQLVSDKELLAQIILLKNNS
jgi:hypothetical protein